MPRSGDFWSGLALAALGGWIVMEARGWTYMGEDGPGAGFFPLWYGSAMVVLSLSLVIRTAMRRGPGPVPATIVWSELRRAFACWLAIVACIALMPLTGFAIAFALLTWFMVAVLARQSHRRAAVIAIAGAIGFQVLFAVVLEVPLPQGLFF